MALDLPESVVSLFLDAGWHPDRRVPVAAALSASVDRSHPSIEILTRLAGLRVGTTGPGVECARSDIDFKWLGPHEFKEVVRWERTLGTRLVGIAEYHHSHCALFVASDGRCFGLSLIHDSFCFEGESIGVASERLLAGRRARPMLRADQPTVSLDGVEFTRESPEIYRY